jgi:hypothetical protein
MLDLGANGVGCEVRRLTREGSMKNLITNRPRVRLSRELEVRQEAPTHRLLESLQELRCLCLPCVVGVVEHVVDLIHDALD